jgi:uncharacterized protein (DUF1330 family)
MAKGYWIAFYRSVSNPTVFAEYAKLSLPIIERGGGRFLARTAATKGYEGGLKERVVLIEFDSVEKAIATIEGPECQLGSPTSRLFWRDVVFHRTPGF